MASTFTSRIFTSRAIMVLVLLCFLVLHGVCDCVSCHGSRARKMLQADLKEHNGSKIVGARNRDNLVGWDLRTVPSGPDPLHHNGKPRTDP